MNQAKTTSLKPAVHPARASGLYSRLHMFRTFRTLLRIWAAPFFGSLIVLDFYYAPTKALGWVPLRLSVPLIAWGMFYAMARKGWLRRRIRTVLMSMWAWLAVILGIMVYQTGGASSMYVVGSMTCSVAIILLFNLPRRLAALSQFNCLVAITIAVLCADSSAGVAQIVTVLLLFSTTTVVTLIGAAGGESLNRVWSLAERRAREELDRHRRSELLKAHFPPLVRQAIEAGTLNLEKRVTIPEAVVGFADIIESTRIGNRIDLAADWALKEAFLTAATARATAAGMVVLNQMGDGFFFLANFRGEDDWQCRLLRFHEQVIGDFRAILAELVPQIGAVESGVRFGVLRGPVMLGWIGKGGQSYFTATGPEVNLAARLCAAARPDEMVVSSKTSYAMESSLVGRTVDASELVLKGFDLPVPAIHIRPGTVPALVG